MSVKQPFAVAPVVCCLGICLATSHAIGVDWPQLKFTQISTGSSTPTSIADDGSGRLFVTEQSGRVMLIQSNGVVPFLDLRDRVLYIPEKEYGLLSVAFSPGFSTNQQLYVFYNRQPDYASTVSRFLVSQTNANVGDASSEQTVLIIPPPENAIFTLSGGELLFGRDGFLYIGMGDSGFGGDSINLAQNTHYFYGKILRIDVESSTIGYRVPNDNPFLANTNYLPEIWALGLRNPWKFSFDRATDDFYLGDVGQIEAEEVDFKPAATQAGQNYGWPIREGLHLYAGPEPSPVQLADPIVEFLHAGRSASITGGYVCRSSSSARLAGVYLYADFYSGRIWGLKQEGSNWLNQELARPPYAISTFGEDSAGQLYLANYGSGKIYKIDDNGQAAAPTFSPAGTNSFTEAIALSCISSNVMIRYTIDGHDPGLSDPGVLSGGTVVISSGATLIARAFRDDLLPSPATSVTYQLKAARPSFDPLPGRLTNGQSISLFCLTPAAAIRFTLDGTDPGAGSEIYLSPLPYSANLTLRARAFRSGFADSSVAVFSNTSLVLENFVSSDGIQNIFDCPSLPGWIYQMQVSEDLIHWRDFGRTQAGTGATLQFQYNNIFPLPTRRLFRVKATEDPSL